MKKCILCVCVLIFAGHWQIVSTEKILVHQPVSSLKQLQKYPHYNQNIPSQGVLLPTGQIYQITPEFPVWKIHKYSGIQINPVRTIPYVHVPEKKLRFEAPPLDHIQRLLGTSSETETIDTLRELASSEDGLNLMANYIKAEYPESEISVKDIISMISQYKISTHEVENEWSQQYVGNSPIHQKYDLPTEIHKFPSNELPEKYGPPSLKRNDPREQFSYNHSPTSPPFNKYSPPIPQHPNTSPSSHKFDSKLPIPNIFMKTITPNKYKPHLQPIIFSKPPTSLKYSLSPLVVDRLPHVLPTLPLQKFDSHLQSFVSPTQPPSDKFKPQVPRLVFPDSSSKNIYNSHLLPSVLPTVHLPSPPPQKYGPPISPHNDPTQEHKGCLTSQNINKQAHFVFTTLPLTPLTQSQKYNSHLPHLVSPITPVTSPPSPKYGPPIPETKLIEVPISHNFDSFLPKPNSPSPFIFSTAPMTQPTLKYTSSHLPSSDRPPLSLISSPSPNYGSPLPVYGIPEMKDSSFLVKAKPIVVLDSQSTNNNNEENELLEQNLGNTNKFQSKYRPPPFVDHPNKKNSEEGEGNSNDEKLIEFYELPKSSSTEVDSTERINQEEIINPIDTEETEEPNQTYVPPTNIYGAPKPDVPINYVVESEDDNNSYSFTPSENTDDSSVEVLSNTGSHTQIPKQQYGLPEEASKVESFTEYGHPKVESLKNKINSYPGYEPIPVDLFEAQKINSDSSFTKDTHRIIPFSITQSGLKLNDFEQGIHILNEENDSIKPDTIIANMWKGAPELLLPSAVPGKHRYQQSSFVPTYEPNKFMLAVENNYVNTDIKPLSFSEVKISQEKIYKDGRDVTALKYEHPSFSYTQFSKKPVDTISNPPHYTQISDIPLDSSLHFESIPGQISSYGEPILPYIFNESLPAASEKKTTVVKADSEEKTDDKLIKESKPKTEKPKEELELAQDEKSVAMKNKDRFVRRKWMPKFKRKEESLKPTIVYAESAKDDKQNHR